MSECTLDLQPLPVSLKGSLKPPGLWYSNICYACPSLYPTFGPLQYFTQNARQSQPGACAANIVIPTDWTCARRVKGGEVLRDQAPCSTWIAEGGAWFNLLGRTSVHCCQRASPEWHCCRHACYLWSSHCCVTGSLAENQSPVCPVSAPNSACRTCFLS